MQENSSQNLCAENLSRKQGSEALAKDRFHRRRAQRANPYGFDTLSDIEKDRPTPYRKAPRNRGRAVWRESRIVMIMHDRKRLAGRRFAGREPLAPDTEIAVPVRKVKEHLAVIRPARPLRPLGPGCQQYPWAFHRRGGLGKTNCIDLFSY